MDSGRPQPAGPSRGAVRAALEARVAAGELARDDRQRALADRLDRLERDLAEGALRSKGSALGWLFGRKAPEPVRGVYLHGDPGRGKTMLADLFFALSRASPKRRVHFHAFMIEVHERIAAHRAGVKAGTAGGDDPIPPVAQAIAGQARLLLFDEFAVTDVADAMILSRLFTALFAVGVTLVATSNVAPDELYRDGLNRPLFLPFVATLKRHADVFPLDGPADYRLAGIGAADAYLTPLGVATSARVDRIWSRLLGGEPERAAELAVKGRRVAIPRSGAGAARLSFDALLRRPLGAADYLALAERFDTLVLEDVPVMGLAERNEAKRFIALIDALYDRRRRLVISAAAPAPDLFEGRSGTEAFEWARAASRLEEMRSEGYLADARAPAGETRSGA